METSPDNDQLTWNREHRLISTHTNKDNDKHLGRVTGGRGGTNYTRTQQVDRNRPQGGDKCTILTWTNFCVPFLYSSENKTILMSPSKYFPWKFCTVAILLS